MKITEITEKIGNLGKSTRDMQRTISVGEAHHIWHTLISRYDALNITNIYLGFVKDNELKLILQSGLEVLNYQIGVLESLMKEIGIPMPNKPPEQANVTYNIDAITDKTIFRDILNRMADTLLIHVNNYRQAASSYIRESFKKLLTREMDLFDKFFEYGKLKGYLDPNPSFRP